MLSIINANIIAPQGIRRGNVIIREGKISAIESRRNSCPREIIDAKGNFVSAGFIDLHIHGDVKDIARTQPRSGTTGFLKTIYVTSASQITKDAREIDMINKNKTGATCLGINMEGPYINKQMRGALPGEFIKKPNLIGAKKIIKSTRGKLKVMTIAPELKGTSSIIKELRTNKTVASIGHTDADFNTATAAINIGATYATHVFNRMKSLSQREPGALGAVLENDKVFAEIILDGIHVHPACFRILLKTKTSDRIILATDSVSCGPILGSMRKGSFFVLKDGTYAGSALTMNKAVLNALKFAGLEICDAVKMATINPAKVLGIDRRKGSIEKGKDADIVIFDKGLNIKTTIVNGNIVYNKL